MLNIFNFFLFLCFIWGFFLLSIAKISTFYIIFGVFWAFIISFLAYKLDFIEKNKKTPPYLCLNFYRHFTFLYLSNLVRNFYLIPKLAFTREKLKPITYTIKVNKDNLNTLIATINMTFGLCLVESNKDSLVIHALDKIYYENFDIDRLIKVSLPQINEDEIV